jgi:hypothetical protein
LLTKPAHLHEKFLTNDESAGGLKVPRLIVMLQCNVRDLCIKQQKTGVFHQKHPGFAVTK